MLISKYSQPEFNPYQDDSPEGEDALWEAPHARSPIDAVVSLPGSKSLTNRELILSALANEPSLLRAPLHSRDTDNMVQALRSLGVSIEERPGEGFGAHWLITPADELIGSTTIDCGLAGTVMRFAPPVAALALGPSMFDADPAARRRPMSTMITALRAIGVDINDDGRGRLPFTVHGFGRVTGGDVTIDASASSQFVSGLLLAAPRFERGIHLRHSGERLPSLPHIEMTIDTLATRGVTVNSPAPGEWQVDPGPIAGREVDIEPDLSNAAPFLAAALVAGGTVTITGWPETTTQVGAQLADLLPRFGAEVSVSGDRMSVTGTGSVRAVDLDLSESGELAPALIAVACFADGPSTITGIGHIRNHETDRLASLVAEITALGGTAEELPDGIRITPTPLAGGVWHTYDDHRMATAGAIIGLGVPGVQIEDVATTAKTLPEFTELWLQMLA